MSYCSVFDSSLFGNCLTDLGVSELLTLKHSLQHLEATEHDAKNHYANALDMKCPERAKENCEKPATMALVANRRGYDATHPSYEPWQPEEKASKLQTLFQISVTALAFLSFGGYLLCLIVQSIKSKGTTYFHPAASTMATLNSIKRIKVYRRNRRSSLPPIEGTQTYDFYGQHNENENENENYYHSTNNPYQYYQNKYSDHN